MNQFLSASTPTLNTSGNVTGNMGYRIKGFNKKDIKKNAMKPIPLDLMKDKITMEKICGLKILKPIITQQQT